MSCAQQPPTALPVPPTATRSAQVVTTNAPATATNRASATIAPTPTNVPPASPTSVPPTRVPATFTKIPPSSTRIPTIPPTVVATQPPTSAPTSPSAPVPPTQPPAPPAAFNPTELFSVPPGVLRMGSPNPDAPADQHPQHDVRMDGFLIERYEVTNAQYEACVRAGVCTRAGDRLNGDAFPVVNVTWDQANAYCTWIGRRMPNEAEWERAARGQDNWQYSWSDRPAPSHEWNAQFHGSPLSFCEASCPLPHFINDVNDGFPTTAPVGSFSSTDPHQDVSEGFNISDMNGNVSEWVSNWYDPIAYQQGAPVDILGPSGATGSKVVRGGSWATEPLPLTTRFSLAPDRRRSDLGFRCAQ